MIPFPDGAEKYRSFRSSIIESAAVVREPESSPILEIDLQAMWFGGEFGRIFRGTAGENIEIVQFGHWNRGAGPDFAEAAVKINGEVRKGPLEIDLQSSYWEDHGHGANPAFDDVVLHVFLDEPKGHFFTRNSAHQSIPQLRLDRRILQFARASDLPAAFPGRCSTPLQDMEDHAIESLLHSAAQFRARQKSRRLLAMASATSASQTLYQAISEALGYRKNKTAMAILAQRNPLGELRNSTTEVREARLFGSAGFMSNEIYDPALSPEAVGYLKHLWAEWWKLRPDVEPEVPNRAIPWVFSATRPMNHPQRRLGALTAILERWNYLSVVWERPGEDLVKKWETRCDELFHPYWQHHYTLTSAPADSDMKLIGKDRQRDILGNVLFPWCLERHEGLWSAFAGMTGSGINEKLRLARLRLFGNDREAAKQWSRKYYQQQALLQIFQDFCLVDASECENCPFPEQILQWQG